MHYALCIVHYELKMARSIWETSQELHEEIKARKLQDNQSIYLYSLEYGVLPSHVQDALKSLISKGQLPRQRFSVSKECMKKPPVKIIWSK